MDPAAWVFKEEPDECGADVTWFEHNKDGTLTMVRCQLKLGESPMNYAQKSETNDTLPKSRDDTFDTTYSAHAISKLAVWSEYFLGLCKNRGDLQKYNITKVRSVLAYTRPLRKAAEVDALAKKMNVVLWDRSHLAKNVWSPCMVTWARRNMNDMYYSDDSGSDS